MAALPPSTANPTSSQGIIAPSSHRLPTVSASQALLGLTEDRSKYVPTGLRALDAILAASNNLNDVAVGGFERGKLTELWGPNGAGKTALALQAATNAMSAGDAVLWVDATKPLNASRISSVHSAKTSPSPMPLSPAQLHQIQVPSLSHLLALLLHPTPEILPATTTLLVIDGLNALIDQDYPRYQLSAPNKTEQQKWQAGRRYGILGFLATALNKLAVLNNLAVIVTTGCSTRMRSDSGLGAALVPGVGGQEWDVGVWNRIVVFRDFGARFVGVQKCGGRSLVSREEVGEVGRLVAFEIDAHGSVRERQATKSTNDAVVVPPRKLVKSAAPKRAFEEIADSEEEDVDEYGWADTDEHALAMESLAVEHSTQQPMDGFAPPPN